LIDHHGWSYPWKFLAKQALAMTLMAAAATREQAMGFQSAVCHDSVVKVRLSAFQLIFIQDSSKPGNNQNRFFGLFESYPLAHTFGTKTIRAARLSNVRGDHASAVD
jgi:hypothetical protein